MALAMPEPQKVPFPSMDFFCLCQPIHTSKHRLWASQVCQADFQEPWDHASLTFHVRPHLSGTLGTETNPLDVKGKSESIQKGAALAGLSFRVIPERAPG